MEPETTVIVEQTARRYRRIGLFAAADIDDLQQIGWEGLVHADALYADPALQVTIVKRSILGFLRGHAPSRAGRERKPGAAPMGAELQEQITAAMQSNTDPLKHLENQHDAIRMSRHISVEYAKTGPAVSTQALADRALANIWWDRERKADHSILKKMRIIAATT